MKIGKMETVTGVVVFCCSVCAIVLFVLLFRACSRLRCVYVWLCISVVVLFVVVPQKKRERSGEGEKDHKQCIVCCYVVVSVGVQFSWLGGRV